MVIQNVVFGCDNYCALGLGNTKDNWFGVCSQRSGKNCGANTNGYSEFIGRYTFPTTPIETFECKSEEAIAEIKKGVSIYVAF